MDAKGGEGMSMPHEQAQAIEQQARQHKAREAAIQELVWMTETAIAVLWDLTPKQEIANLRADLRAVLAAFRETDKQ